jgi:hypothetical protein
MRNNRKQSNGKHSREYSSWQSIKNRIKNDSRLVLDSAFETFEDYYNWYTSQKGYNVAGWRLHRKVFNKNNIQYTPDELCFLPPLLYGALQKNKNVRGDYPIGVSYNSKAGTFQAFMSYGEDQSVALGSFANEIDAFNMYKHEKEKYIRKLAEDYKGMLDQRVYLALVNYTIEISD